MDLPLEFSRVSSDIECYEDKQKFIKYKVTNVSRFPIKDIDISGYTIKEDGEKTSKNFCTRITGIKERLMPKDNFEITVTVKVIKDYKDSIDINGVLYLSACDIAFKTKGNVLVSKVVV